MTLPNKAQRPRRLRTTATIREAVAQTRLSGEQLIQPHFCLPAEKGSEPIASMPGIHRNGTQDMLKTIAGDLAMGQKDGRASMTTISNVSVLNCEFDGGGVTKQTSASSTCSRRGEG